MTEILEFDIVHFYDLQETGIPLEIKLGYGGLTAEFTATIDTGSTFSSALRRSFRIGNQKRNSR